jgi:hypothetical protein
MENRFNPFEYVLDNYASPSESLFMKLSKSKGFPSLVSTHGLLKVKLLKLSFVHFISQYINSVNRFYFNNDISEWLKEMEVEKFEQELFYLLGQENVEWVNSPSERLTDMAETLVLNQYNNFWQNLFKKKYKNGMALHELLAKNLFKNQQSVFEEDYGSLSFCEEFLRQNPN